MSATEGLVVAHGYWHFTITDIQTATGLATSTFYFYFPTKLAAVLAAFQRVVDALYEVAGRQYPGRSEYERIVLANHAYLSLWQKERRVLSEMFALSLVEPTVADMYRGSRLRFEARVTGRIRRLLRQKRIPPADPVLTGALLTGLVEAFALRYTSDEPGHDVTLQQAVEAVSEFWWRLVYAGPVPDFDSSLLEGSNVLGGGLTP